MLMAIGLLAGCGDRTPSNTEHAASDKAPGATDPEMIRLRKLSVLYEQKREELAERGQGCPGKVLKDQDLLNAVVGKVEKSSSIPPSFEVYRTNGRLESNDPGPVRVPQYGTYRINGDRICTKYSRNGHETGGCYRIVKVGTSEMMREVLNGPNLETTELSLQKSRLGCIPLRLRTVEGK